MNQYPDDLEHRVAKALYEAERKHHHSEAAWEALLRMNEKNGYVHAKDWYQRMMAMARAAIKEIE